MAVVFSQAGQINLDLTLNTFEPTGNYETITATNQAGPTVEVILKPTTTINKDDALSVMVQDQGTTTNVTFFAKIQTDGTIKIILDVVAGHGYRVNWIVQSYTRLGQAVVTGVIV